MVDALFVAAKREDSEYFEDKEEVIPHQPTQRASSQVRVCEFCGSSNTPTWRRGPGGKGSLCNACGIKWRLRKRTKKGDAVVDKVKTTKSPTAKRRRVSKETDNDHMTSLRQPIMFKENVYEDDDESRKNYYCKFCNKTWDSTHFKNSQQFGAHCSNCSRRPQLDGMVPGDDFSSSSSSPTYSPSKPSFVPSPSSPSSSSSPSTSPSYYEVLRMPKRFPPPFEDPGYNLILILRLMQEADDLSDYEEETPSTHMSHPLSHSHAPSLTLSHPPHSLSHSRPHVHSHPLSHSHTPMIPTPTPVL